MRQLLDLFDRIYLKWGTYALNHRLDPPQRERWDEIVLFLLMSKDPVRMARYKRIEADGPESLGSDAYELWRKLPDYMPARLPELNTVALLKAHAEAHPGTMRALMERRNLGDLYSTIIAEQEEIEKERRARAKRGQQSIIIMGCAGMGAILIMILTVMFIILLQMMK